MSMDHEQSCDHAELRQDRGCGVMIHIAGPLVGLQVEMDTIEEVISPIEVTQKMGIIVGIKINRRDDYRYRRDSRERSRSPGFDRGYRGRMKVGKQLSKVRDGQNNKQQKIDEEANGKAFIMQSVSSLLENLGLGIDSTN